MLGWILALVLGWWPHPCVGDVNGDRVVNILDLSMQAGYYLQTVEPGTKGDVNYDGVVNMADVDLTRDNYGHICTTVVIPGLAVD